MLKYLEMTVCTVKSIIKQNDYLENPLVFKHSLSPDYRSFLTKKKFSIWPVLCVCVCVEGRDVFGLACVGVVV